MAEVSTLTGNVVYKNALILECNQRLSKAGNPFSTLRFLDQDSLLVFDVMQFSEDAVRECKYLVQGSRYDLEFTLMPGRDGGVRLVLYKFGESMVDYS